MRRKRVFFCLESTPKNTPFHPLLHLPHVFHSPASVTCRCLPDLPDPPACTRSLATGAAGTRSPTTTTARRRRTMRSSIDRRIQCTNKQQTPSIQSYPKNAVFLPHPAYFVVVGVRLVGQVHVGHVGQVHLEHLELVETAVLAGHHKFRRLGKQH